MKLASRLFVVSVSVIALVCVTQFSAIAEDDSMEETFARYARYGADVWLRNPLANISGEGQACISCHTTLPYALVEPLLPGEYDAYEDLLAQVDRRITGWDDNTAWYADQKLREFASLGDMPSDALIGVLSSPGSRGVESIFNALIRAMRDGYAGQAASATTKRALDNMWAEQLKSGPDAGRWDWIYANLVPWEVQDSDVWGASLACVAANIYPDLAPHDELQLLYRSLEQAATDTAVSLHSKAGIAWCDAESGAEVLDTDVSAGIVSELTAIQRSDGGWSLRDLGPWPDWEGSERDCCAKRELRTDAYATGFVTLVLSRNAAHLDAEQVSRLDDAVAWIDVELANPYPDGPRYNRHGTTKVQIPEFRNNLYPNAGAMWSFLAKTVHEAEQPPWRTR